MEILARGVGRRKEAVAQVLMVKGTGKFIINNIPAQQYLHNSTTALLSVKAPLNALNFLKGDSDNLDTLSLASTFRNPPLHSAGTGAAIERGDVVAVDGSVQDNGGLNQTSLAVLKEASSCPQGLSPKEPETGVAALQGLTTEETQEQAQQTSGPYGNMDTIVKVKGGGLAGQTEAIRYGLAKACCLLATETRSTEEIRKQLKDKGYLTQDSRVKERRKYGLKKARKATQYNKR
uniref:Small ribosomal subunit protein uS9c n=1 Tax=Stephanosphaera pluvialis TaxID=51712 RepID=A0A0S2IDT0_9CHLO|nr:ribosomal protein S9 [Stephanosphaera pluvialis]